MAVFARGLLQAADGGILLPGVVTLSLLLFAPLAWAEASLDLRVVQSGHSLTDPIPGPLSSMVQAAGGRGGIIDASTIPGSPMDWRWNNAAEPDIRQPEIMAGYDVLVLTERVPLSGTLQWHESPRWALHWFEHAWQHGRDGAGARTVLYATWVSVESGPNYDNEFNDPEGHIPFRERLALEMERWEAIHDYVNANRPDGSPEMPMIPGPLIMAAAFDAIEAGEAPGLTRITDLFTDDIHVSEMGAYLVALGHFAVIYERDPRGLPAGSIALGGPNEAQAAWMQDLVWRVVSDYPGSGLGR